MYSWVGYKKVSCWIFLGHLLLLVISAIICLISFNLMFPFRSPSVSRIRSKMLYATSKDRFRRALEGIHYEIQATDPTEMDLEVLRERAHWFTQGKWLFIFKRLHWASLHYKGAIFPASICYRICIIVWCIIHIVS